VPAQHLSHAQDMCTNSVRPELLLLLLLLLTVVELS
jgi:hypothetical protein